MKFKIISKEKQMMQLQSELLSPLKLEKWFLKKYSRSYAFKSCLNSKNTNFRNYNLCLQSKTRVIKSKQSNKHIFADQTESLKSNMTFVKDMQYFGDISQFVNFYKFAVLLNSGKKTSRLESKTRVKMLFNCHFYCFYVLLNGSTC